MREAQGTISLTDQKTAPKTLTDLRNMIDVAQMGNKTAPDGALLPLPIALPKDEVDRSIVRETLVKLAVQEIGDLPEDQRVGVQNIIINFRAAIDKLLGLKDCDFNRALVDPEVGVVRMLISRIALMLGYHKLMPAADILASFEEIAGPVNKESSGAGSCRKRPIGSIPWSRMEEELGWLSEGTAKSRKGILEERFKETGGRAFASLNQKMIARVVKAKPYAQTYLFALEENYKAACEVSGITDQAEKDNIYTALLQAACETLMSEKLTVSDIREMFYYVYDALLKVEDVKGLNKVIDAFKIGSCENEEDRTPTKMLR